jgi:hypothetical protein
LFNLGNKVWVLSTQPAGKSGLQHLQGNPDFLVSESATGNERLTHGDTILTLQFSNQHAHSNC